MPNIKLKDGTGIERTYNNVQSITAPLADGTGSFTYGVNDKMLPRKYDNSYWGMWNYEQLKDYNALSAISNCDISNMNYMFTNFNGDIDLSGITINLQFDDSDCGAKMEYCFKQDTSLIRKIKSLPVINNFKVAQASNTFHYTDWSESNITPTEFINTITGLYTKSYNTNGTGTSGTGYPNFDGTFGNTNIEELDLSHLGQSGLKYSWDSINSFIGNMYFLKSITMFVTTAALTSNKNMLSTSMNMMLGHIKFETDSGTPYKANWKAQTIDLSQASQYAVGWLPSNWNTAVRLPFTNITPSSGTTLAETTQLYNSLKDSSERWACLGGSANTNTTWTSASGTSYSCKIGRLFSHYNHDSAVELINSLPDTSEYIATAGGTNTIKFHPASGGLTDEGAVETLTAEEIAVATAKGWTVTFSGYTN